jgi:hypothetical protein
VRSNRAPLARANLVALVQATNRLAWSLEGTYRDDRRDEMPARIRDALDEVHAALAPYLPGARDTILAWTAMGSSS